MTQSSKILAAAALTGLSLTFGGLTAIPFYSSAGAVEVVGEDFATDRIAVAFDAAAQVAADPAGMAAAVRSPKGDLLAKPGCAGQNWPEIAPACLATADGSAVRPVRTVTIGYQTGDATTVLIRMPAPQVASR